MHVVAELGRDRGQLRVRLSVPEAVLEPEEAVEARVVNTAGKSERPAVDQVVVRAERVVGGAEARIVEVRGQPQPSRIGETARLDGGRQRVGVAFEPQKPRAQARAIRERREMHLIRVDGGEGPRARHLRAADEADVRVERPAAERLALEGVGPGGRTVSMVSLVPGSSRSTWP